jgi:quercetin dioxygenase-like cupin family protein
MPGWTKKNFEEIEDRSPEETMQWRFSRNDVGSTQVGVSRFRYEPGVRMPFGHRHGEQEEVYVVTRGSGRFKLDDEITDVTAGQVVYCSPEVMREWEAGDDGMTLVAFGAHADGDGNMEPGWWTD